MTSTVRGVAVALVAAGAMTAAVAPGGAGRPEAPPEQTSLDDSRAVQRVPVQRTGDLGSAVETPRPVGFERSTGNVVGTPSTRIRGAPGRMTIVQSTCGALPTAGVRRRVVELAAQEWGFFGFGVADYTIAPEVSAEARRRAWRRRARRDPEEAARVASSIGGYWSTTPQGTWILDEQNEAWNGSRGAAARWRYPWSAAFISWVMCEAGLAEPSRFARAVAHHVYIDQAIRAVGAASPAAFVARDVGAAPISPGDLLCSGRRPPYRSIAERRRQLGTGARTHCDIVVKLDEAGQRIMAIGGNVRGSVTLKLMPAAQAPGLGLRPVGGRRPLFAHLQLRDEPIEPDALDRTATMRALACGQADRPPSWLAAERLVAPGVAADGC